MTLFSVIEKRIGSLLRLGPLGEDAAVSFCLHIRDLNFIRGFCKTALFNVCC